MQIGSSTYLGLETLVRLAVQNPKKPCTTQGLAKWINRSVSYTETLMAQFQIAGLVVSQQGSCDRYILAKPAKSITVAEVFQIFDDPSNFPIRPLNANTLEAEETGNLRGVDLLSAFLEGYILLFLNSVSLADLASEADGIIRENGRNSTAGFIYSEAQG